MRGPRVQLKGVVISHKAIASFNRFSMRCKCQSTFVLAPSSTYEELCERDADDMLRSVINRRIRRSQRQESFYNRPNAAQKIQHHRDHADDGDRAPPIQDHLLKLHEDEHGNHGDDRRYAPCPLLKYCRKNDVPGSQMQSPERNPK